MKSNAYVRRRPLVAVLLLAACIWPSMVWSSSAGRQEILAGYAAEVKVQSQAGPRFSADRGRALFMSRPAAGKPDTPSCTSCHSTNPFEAGRTRAGKAIEPMALSKTPGRYADRGKVEKWFRRNCNSVLGRACTPLEKGDFLTFMISQ